MPGYEISRNSNETERPVSREYARNHDEGHYRILDDGGESRAYAVDEGSPLASVEMGGALVVGVATEARPLRNQAPSAELAQIVALHTRTGTPYAGPNYSGVSL